jgi:hypothetical protein
MAASIAAAFSAVQSIKLFLFFILSKFKNQLFIFVVVRLKNGCQGTGLRAQGQGQKSGCIVLKEGKCFFVGKIGLPLWSKTRINETGK